MEMTFVIGCQPMDIDTSRLEKESSSWDDVEHPPDDEDGVLHVLHVIKWNEGGRERMEATTMRPSTSHRNTARIAGWFEAEGTIVGDGRTWDQVRFNEFPSRRQFMKVVADPRRLKARRPS